MCPAFGHTAKTCLCRVPDRRHTAKVVSLQWARSAHTAKAASLIPFQRPAGSHTTHATHTHTLLAPPRSPRPHAAALATAARCRHSSARRRRTPARSPAAACPHARRRSPARRRRAPAHPCRMPARSPAAARPHALKDHMLDDFHEAHFEGEHSEEEPEPTAKAYYDMLAAA